VLMDSLDIWSETFEKQCHLRDQHAHVVELQEQCVEEAVNRLESTQTELEKARFSLKRANLAYAEFVQEMSAVSSPPRIMYDELRSRRDKVAERTRSVTACEQQVVELEKAVDDAQEQLAFDQDQQQRILAELTTITKRIEQLSANTLKS